MPLYLNASDTASCGSKAGISILNGSRIWLASIPLDNAQSGVFSASYEGAKMSFQRLKDTGVNFMYAHNYDSEPGSHISFAEVLKAADDTGMLISQSQPHFSAYDWDGPDADRINGYAHHAAFYARVAGNHPSVVFYSTSHNATGYAQDMNPDQIGARTRMEGPSPSKNVPKALSAEVIVKKLDPSRILYHHASGNLSSAYVCNFYGNWIPAQEMNEWFGNWAKNGELPAMLLEYATPFTWDFGMYRGWYKGKRAFGEALVPWEFCLAEWKAQFMGDKAYSISEFEKENLRWEAMKFKAGKVWGRSEYPYGFDSSVHDDRNIVLAEHHASNWRAFRTWGVSGVNSMWHFTQYWRLKKNVEKKPKYFKTDWENIQKPGYSPDLIMRQRERFDMGYEMTDWEETIAAKAITENQGPLLAYIAGKPENFTDKAHNFLPGETFEKQIIIVNNSRQAINCQCKWVLNLNDPLAGNQDINILTGDQQRIPLKFDLPSDLLPGEYEIKADFIINKNIKLTDSFRIHIMAGKRKPQVNSVIALFDPEGDTAKLLDKFGIAYKVVEAVSDLPGIEILMIGKGALTTDGFCPDITSVREGLKVIIFEQTAEVLEQRFGFRVQEYGLRKVFQRIAGHPVFDGINETNLRDWKGEATIIPPKLEGAPAYKWCGISVPRAWRCGTRGNVASVLIEKPSCGNFMPLADGGFSLQYSPLMEYREGRGMVLFCQMDVSGRTEDDPAAEMLAGNIISYTSGWKPASNRLALYAGDPAGKAYLERASIAVQDYSGGKLQPDQALIAGPGSGQILAKNIRPVKKWMKAGGRLMTIGLDQQELNTLLPGLQLKNEEHIAAYFEPFESASPFAGVASADVHNRDPRDLPLIRSGATIAGNGIMAETEGVTMCQLVPWQMDYSNEKHNVKQTFRRSAFLLNRLLGNMGIASSIEFLSRFSSPVDKSKDEKRWLTGLYLDVPEEWDDPYRFFRW
jgi:beta-galactosidase